MTKSDKNLMTQWRPDDPGSTFEMEALIAKALDEMLPGFMVGRSDAGACATKSLDNNWEIEITVKDGITYTLYLGESKRRTLTEELQSVQPEIVSYSIQTMVELLERTARDRYGRAK